MVTLQACRGEVRKAKAKLELNVASDLKGNKTNLYDYIKSKRKSKETNMLYGPGYGKARDSQCLPHLILYW